MAGLITAGRPTVSLGGQASGSLAEGLLRLRTHESTDGLSSCEARFGNWGAKDSRVGFLYFDRSVVDFGKDLAISVSGRTLFQGRITGLEADYPPGGGGQLTALAEDRYQDLRMTRRTRTFTDVTDAEVIAAIVAEHGLPADVKLDGPKHRVLTQLNQSDLAFLRDRARAVDAELWLDGSTVTARTRADRTGSVTRLGYGNELREVSVLADLAGQRTSVTVSGWDMRAKQAVKEKADASALGGELRAGFGGSRLLAEALGERVETVVHSVPLTGQEAKARAQMLYRRNARRFLTARGVAETATGLRVGTTVNLTGLGGPFSGEYYVTEVTHLFDDEDGMRTEFRAERPWLGAAS